MRYAGVFKKAAHDRAEYVPDLPGCVTTGRTLEDTRRPIVEVIQFQIEPMQLRGEPAPEPIIGRPQIIISILKGGLMALETWFCLANLVLSDSRNQVGIARLDFTCTPAGFSDQALSRMNNPNTGYRRRLWLNVLLLCAPRRARGCPGCGRTWKLPPPCRPHSPVVTICTPGGAPWNTGPSGNAGWQ